MNYAEFLSDAMTEDDQAREIMCELAGGHDPSHVLIGSKGEIYWTCRCCGVELEMLQATDATLRASGWTRWFEWVPRRGER